MTNRNRVPWLQWSFVLAGVLLLGLWSRTELVARVFQAAQAAELDAALAQGAPEAAIVAARPATGVHGSRTEVLARRPDALGRLEIPRLGIRAIVAEGVDEKTLARAIGHVTTTAKPGKPGNCALAGHRDTFLRGLGNVRVNDVIRIVTRERTYVYEVEWTEIVEPRRVDVLDPTPQRAVTLITCYPFRYVGHAPKRFIVRARQVDALANALPGRDPD
jgi:sortase A